MALYGYRCTRGEVSPEKFTAGGTIVAGTPVVVATDDGYVDQCADNAVLAYGIAMNAATVGQDVIVIPGGTGVQFEMSYAGTAWTVTGYGDKCGTDGTKPDLDNTTQELFVVKKIFTKPGGKAVGYFEIPNDLCQAFLEID